MENQFDKWIDFLKPENLKGNLISCALYISIFESFKDYIIEEVRFFYHNGFVDNVDLFSPKYQNDVLSMNKSQLYATLYWLKEQEAIDDNDISLFEELKAYRNRLTHEMMQLVFDGTFNDYPQKLYSLIDLRIRIEKWWILNIEIPTNPDLDSDMDIKEDEIQTSSQIFYRIIMDILTGDEETSNYYYSEFLKYKKEK